MKEMVADLSLPIDIQSGATQRAEDGLALSSRNQYLSASERAVAPLLLSPHSHDAPQQRISSSRLKPTPPPPPRIIKRQPSCLSFAPDR